MNKLLILLFWILLVGCCREPKLLKNGLTKSASQITEYTILIKRDSLNNESQDTLMLREKIYNDNHQIINLFQRTFFDNEKMEINYSYNELNKIKKEVVKMSTDSLPFMVNYNYKDTLLYQSKAIVNYPNEKFEQIETYYYRKDNTKEKSKTTQLFIDLKSSDTIRNSVSTTYFDKNEIATKVETVHKPDSKRNRKIVYEYDCQKLIGLKEFNENDSLISTFKYEYDLDKFDNWIAKRIYENGKIDRLLTREIEYK
ncbi:hypothetical protein OOZ15_13355 [Galbibacter sp. EGI 63066]|uniref:hypothetical protein n=1 Tax=Galbibacter sp. EGI 63066 TaxID=2993559 RepID=UPI002248F6F3|nr:hypothetical protein [Galbibacter sp. EGI 63066]MCX2680934.1 hypothetical protein [Galbibacter sp. EGI 63066]